MMPFLGGIQSTANGTLILSVAAALIYAEILDARPTLLRSALKTLAVTLLAVLVVSERGPFLLAVALGLSAVGDACLSRDGEKAFLAGLGSFLAAHLAYIVLFAWNGGGAGTLAEPWRAALAIAMAGFGLTMLLMLWRRVNPGLRLPILAYAVAIAGMGVASLTVPSFWIIAGALLFLASDGLLAAERFLVAAISPHRDWMRHAVWGLYYAAQLSMTLGALLS
jgi:uncharacterized membrane protein YhhN